MCAEGRVRGDRRRLLGGEEAAKRARGALPRPGDGVPANHGRASARAGGSRGCRASPADADPRVAHDTGVLAVVQGAQAHQGQETARSTAEEGRQKVLDTTGLPSIDDRRQTDRATAPTRAGLRRYCWPPPGCTTPNSSQRIATLVRCIKIYSY